MLRRSIALLALVVAVGASGAAPVPKGGKQNYAVALPTDSIATGFVAPGSKIDLLVTLRTDNQLEAFPLVVDVLVVAVEADETVRKLPKSVTVTVSVTEKQAKALGLAKRRKCQLGVLLQHPDKRDDRLHNIDAVIKKLSAAEPAPPPRIVERK